ncbi:MAG: 23S rRNA (pseudouridine(1915)-N(3))-methyltransferase RlmH [Planctomycetes bacterium]|nr:23S rRNA (pseudouridine(1915)-N(3))-methyltransferase RlmH [Planctomycetota bacterium]
MKIRLLTVSQRQPAWVVEGTAEYVRRLPRVWGFEVVEVKPAPRGSGATVQRSMAIEAERLSAVVAKTARVIALDERGEPWSTEDVAKRLSAWLRQGQDIALVIGGADGLDPTFRQQAAERWSLSAATLPHGLVRIVVAEQLYRAATLLDGHPYHRR